VIARKVSEIGEVESSEDVSMNGIAFEEGVSTIW
jgi:hypothetical protein